MEYNKVGGGGRGSDGVDANGGLELGFAGRGVDEGVEDCDCDWDNWGSGSGWFGIGFAGGGSDC